MIKLISIVISFIIPGKIIEEGTLIRMAFGFPCQYLLISQENKGSLQLFNNLFNGNIGVNISILDLFANVVAIYILLVLIKKLHVKVTSK